MIHLDGVSVVHAKALSALGIDTADLLLEAGATARGRAQIAAETGISPDLIVSWVNLADLLRIRGIGWRYLDLLHAAGVGSVAELGQAEPAHLQLAMFRANEQRQRVGTLPTETRIKRWINQARSLPRVVRM